LPSWPIAVSGENISVEDTFLDPNDWLQGRAGIEPVKTDVPPKMPARPPGWPRVLRTNPMTSLWNAERLHDFIDTRLKGWKFIVVSNREPFMHQRRNGSVECVTTAGGLTTALRPILAAGGGTWIAHGAGDADRQTADAQGCLAVPPGKPSYKLRRIWLSREQEQGFYYGLSNEGLWPLCHITFTRPTFRLEDWEHYRDVNRIFAEAVLEEAGNAPTFVFIQDYHFCMLPRMLKDAGKTNMVVAQFWHIPWPNRETFRIFPWAEELLHGLTGNDLLGFHIRYHCQNFLDTAERNLEVRVDREHWSITRGGRDTMVRPFPISIDFARQAALAASPEVEQAMEAWRQKLRYAGPDLIIGAGIERMDYTKGIPDRLRALDLFFGNHPEWRGRLSFVQIAAPSRSRLDAYRAAEQEVAALAEHINGRWGTSEWKPVHLLVAHHGPVEMTALHRLARFMIVNSLHDGMNLVAKEYCASRIDNDGVLILSRFTGAYRELRDAIGVNPYAVHEIANAIHTALTMDESERVRRMTRMRSVVEQNNVYRWAGKILANLLHVDLPEESGIDDDSVESE
jgi:trehalose-6-phosphate synthase